MQGILARFRSQNAQHRAYLKEMSIPGALMEPYLIRWTGLRFLKESIIFKRRPIMKFNGVCIETDDAPRLAEFYRIVLQEEPFVEGSHYSFSKVAVYDPGDVKAAKDKNVWLIFSDADIDALYERLLHEIPGIEVIQPPERKPWGAYSFWFNDPDGNKIAVYQEVVEK